MILAAALLQVSSIDTPAFAGVTVTIQPNPNPDIKPYLNSPSNEPNASQSSLVKLIREKIKYVFVIFNENHSFDNEYGTFPGVNGSYSDGQHPRSADNTPGFTQEYTSADGSTVTVQPFLISPAQNSNVLIVSITSHKGLANKIDVVNGPAQMDKFAYREYNRFASQGGAANISKGTQYANLVMSHIDCNTIPFFLELG